MENQTQNNTTEVGINGWWNGSTIIAEQTIIYS